MTALRKALASDIASGLAGWLQLQIVQRLGELSGEDAARLVVAQVVNAQGRYKPATSQLPRNWGSTKKRIDIALKGRSDSAALWYGAIEIKWAGLSSDLDAVRLALVQDVMRLAFIKTANLNAHFLVLGGSTAGLLRLFDDRHRQAAARESRRIAFRRLLSRRMKYPSGSLTYPEWNVQFPKAGDRIPPSVFGGYTGKLSAALLAVAASTVSSEIVGNVYVWQCSRRDRS